MDFLYISLAYKYVMLTLMLAEVNHAVGKLEIPNWQPITFAQVETYNISAPRIRAGGSLDTTNGVFGFGENMLQFMQWPEPNSNLPLRERQKCWSKLESQVDTNGAYQLATGWLTKLDVDISALENKHPVSVMQQFFYPGGDINLPPVLLPRFEVRWGKNPSLPAVWVSVFGPTKTPLFIRQEDGSFIRRPELIKPEAVENLLSITNADFVNWRPMQRSNLVMQSAGNVYQTFFSPDGLPDVKASEHKRIEPVTDSTQMKFPAKKTKTLPAAKRD